MLIDNVHVWSIGASVGDLHRSIYSSKISLSESLNDISNFLETKFSSE